MTSTPPVDRRSLLRGALWAAGAAAGASVVSGCGDQRSTVPEARGSASPSVPGKPSKASGSGQSTPNSGNHHHGEGDGRPQQPKGPDGSDPSPTGEPTPSSSPTDQPTKDPVDPKSHDGHGHDGPGGDHQPHHDADPDPDPSDPGGGEPPGPGEPGGPPPLVNTADVPVGGGVVLTSSRVVVTQATAGTFRCFTNRCTHMGCAVDAVTDGTIHCPCHGSLFAIDTGKPVAGPAPKPLSKVPIIVKAGVVYLS